MLQTPYNKVYYDLIGNEQAQRFFQVDRETGDVKLKTSLLQDPALAENYQVGFFVKIKICFVSRQDRRLHMVLEFSAHLVISLISTFQLIIRAEDGGFPPRRGQNLATLNVNVQRNLFAPQFTQSSYISNVRKDLGYGNRVTTVQATDSDRQVCTPTS